VRADRLEEEINLQITLYLTDPASIDADLKEALNAEARDEKKRSLVRIEQNIAELEDEKRRMLTAIKKGIASIDDFAADMKDCSFRMEQQRSKVAFLQEEINASLSSATLTQMAAQIAAEFATFAYMPFEKKLGLSASTSRKSW
jgi:chromosome segregation ATPase